MRDILIQALIPSIRHCFPGRLILEPPDFKKSFGHVGIFIPSVLETCLSISNNNNNKSTIATENKNKQPKQTKQKQRNIGHSHHLGGTRHWISTAAAKPMPAQCLLCLPSFVLRRSNWLRSSLIKAHVDYNPRGPGAAYLWFPFGIKSDISWQGVNGQTLGAILRYFLMWAPSCMKFLPVELKLWAKGTVSRDTESPGFEERLLAYILTEWIRPVNLGPCQATN